MDIMLVDDDATAAQPIARYLIARGHAVTTLDSGRKALELLRRGPSPDLVIADIQMPGTDGLEVLNAVRAQDPDLPVILMTGHATVDTAIRALRNRACDYLIKPIDMEALIMSIARLGRA